MLKAISSNVSIIIKCGPSKMCNRTTVWLWNEKCTDADWFKEEI